MITGRQLLKRSVASCALVILWAGCSQTPTGISGPDSAPHSDGGARSPDGAPGSDALLPRVPLKWKLVLEAKPGSTPQVALDGALDAQGRLQLKVVLSQAHAVQGVAFRLAHDPAALQLTKFALGKDFADSPRPFVHKFAQQPQGELWAGAALLGDKNTLDGPTLEVATVEYKVVAIPKAGAVLRLSFQPEHCAAQNGKGEDLRPTWIGARLEAVPAR